MASGKALPYRALVKKLGKAALGVFLFACFARGATPTGRCYLGSVTESNNTTENVTSYTVPMQPVLSGNLAVFMVTFASTSQTPTMSDENSGTWTTVLLEKDTTNTQTFAIYYRFNVTDSTHLPKITFSPSVPFVQAAACEYWNVQNSSDPVDGHAGNFVASAATSMTSGSFTPTTNGDLILGGFNCDSGCSSSVNTFTAGSGFTARANDGLQSDQFIIEEEIQGTAGAINPGATSANSIGYVAEGVAFKAASAGTAPSGNYFSYIGHYNTHNGTDLSIVLRTPCRSNHPIISYTGGAGAGSRHITGITDSNSNTWNQAGSGINDGNNNEVQIFYVEGGTCGATMSVTVTLTGTDTGSAGDTLMFYDAQGLATSSSLDVSGSSSGTDASSTSFNVTLLTPTAGDMVITAMSVAKDTVTALSSSPGTAAFNSTTTGGETPASHEDENNGNGFILSAGSGQITWTWTHDNSQQTGVGAWAQYAAAFKTASAPACTPTLMRMGVGRCG